MEKYVIECDPHESMDRKTLATMAYNELAKSYGVRLSKDPYTFETDKEISLDMIVRLYNRGILLTHLGNKGN